MQEKVSPTIKISISAFTVDGDEEIFNTAPPGDDVFRSVI